MLSMSAGSKWTRQNYNQNAKNFQDCSWAANMLLYLLSGSCLSFQTLLQRYNTRDVVVLILSFTKQKINGICSTGIIKNQINARLVLCEPHNKFANCLFSLILMTKGSGGFWKLLVTASKNVFITKQKFNKDFISEPSQILWKCATVFSTVCL